MIVLREGAFTGSLRSFRAIRHDGVQDLSRAKAATLVALAVCVFLGSWSLVHHGTFARGQITDTGLYESDGDAIARGAVPYRDLDLPYPPASIPVFVLPALGHEGDQAAYDRWFDRLMALCGCLALVGAALVLRSLSVGAVRMGLALGVIAISPLLIGSLELSRFDFWPTALAVLALAALLRDRLVLAALGLGTAIAAKLWPVVLVPLAIAWVWRRRGRAAVAPWTAGLVAVDVAMFLPFAVLGPRGLSDSFYSQLARPLQLESLGAAILIAIHHVAGTALHVRNSFGSQNVTGPGAHAAQMFTTAFQAIALLVVWTLYARGPATSERLVRYSAAAVAAFLAFGKVFSPQFAIWLIPLAPLVRGRRGVAAGTLLAAILALTQSWFPHHYWSLAGFASLPSWELLARDLLVLALAIVLAWPGLRAAPAKHELATSWPP